jgi:hypothetical protein
MCCSHSDKHHKPLQGLSRAAASPSALSIAVENRCRAAGSPQSANCKPRSQPQFGQLSLDELHTYILNAVEQRFESKTYVKSISGMACCLALRWSQSNTPCKSGYYATITMSFGSQSRWEVQQNVKVDKTANHGNMGQGGSSG